jgi:hypothetical protein
LWENNGNGASTFFVVSNQQLYLAVGIPLLFNATLIGVLIAYVNAKLRGLEDKFEARFDAVDTRLDAMNKRFDDMRDLWRAELNRVEEVLDARLKHLEQARG